MIILVGFDATIVKHEYPAFGAPVPFAIQTLRDLQQQGHQLILYTVRDGVELQQAVDYCAYQGVRFWGINQNPEQATWNESPKVHGDLCIDDRNLGCPLIVPPNGQRPWIDWATIRKIFDLPTIH